MEALSEVVCEPEGFPAGLYWVVRPNDEPLPSVLELLDLAQANGKAAALVEAENFDELTGALDRQLEFPPALANHVRAARATHRVTLVALPTQAVQRFPVLRTSALPVVSIPLSARRIILAEPSTTRELRGHLRTSGVRWAAVACLGREVAAFGRDEEFLAAFSDLNPRLEGELPLRPDTDSWAIGLLYEALVHALARGRPLRMLLSDRRGHGLRVWPPRSPSNDNWARDQQRRLQSLRVAYKEPITGAVPALAAPFVEATGIQLEHWLNQWWCVLDPHTWIERPHGDNSDAPEEPPGWTDAAADWRRERWARRYNDRWNDLLAAWAHLLVPERVTPVHLAGIGTEAGIDAVL